jgi:hypothetical protein
MEQNSSTSGKKADSLSYPPLSIVHEGGDKFDMTESRTVSTIAIAARAESSEQTEAPGDNKPSRSARAKSFIKKFIKQYWYGIYSFCNLFQRQYLTHACSGS